MKFRSPSTTSWPSARRDRYQLRLSESSPSSNPSDSFAAQQFSQFNAGYKAAQPASASCEVRYKTRKPASKRCPKTNRPRAHRWPTILDRSRTIRQATPTKRWPTLIQ
eukprot:839711-Amphidinium_carterae.1